MGENVRRCLGSIDIEFTHLHFHTFYDIESQSSLLLRWLEPLH